MEYALDIQEHIKKTNQSFGKPNNKLEGIEEFVADCNRQTKLLWYIGIL